MVGLTGGEKSLRFMFARFDTIGLHERNGRTLYDGMAALA